MTKFAQRRQYVIDYPFQIRFIIKFCVVTLISTMLFGALIYGLSAKSTTVAIENTRVFVKPTSDFILPALLATFVVVTALTAVIVAVIVMLVSHRISGPVYRLIQDVEGMKGGDLNRSFTIRSHDQLQVLARGLSDLSRELRDQQFRLNEKFHTVRQLLEEYDYKLSVDEAEQARNLLNRMEQELSRFTFK